MDPEISVNSSTMKQATAVPRFAFIRPGESREMWVLLQTLHHGLPML